MKNIFASSIVAIALAGAMATALAEENAMPMPNQQMMMKGQPQTGGMPGTKPCYGPGKGMMGGMGPGMMGGGGMMGGMGQGMMGGGMGMMGGMGPGMMGGGGMMGGMGQGMMSRMAMLDLSDAQAEQLEKIQAEAMKKQRKLMRQMWDEQEKMSDLYDEEKRDPASIGKAYSKLSDIHRQAIEIRIDTENKAAAVLSKEQKAQMRRGFGRGMMGY
ncbi:MAG: Spy/CpxP family protein refolding chaperone [Pseudomonadota bacterium]